MYEAIQAIVLGLVQGLTEFIPVSSEAHLIITDDLLGFTIGNLAFDVLLHLGTLAALLLYFRRDLLGFGRSLIDKSRPATTIVHLAIATAPAAIAGYFAYDVVMVLFRSMWLIAIMLVVLAVLMFVADRRSGQRSLADMRLKDAVLIGLAQVLALVPGTSRSGSTIVAGSLLKFNNAEAARFSFYMAIPILLGANVRVLVEPGTVGQIGENWLIYLVGITVAFLSGYVVIAFLLKYLSRHKLAVFAWYRIILAAVLVGILMF